MPVMNDKEFARFMKYVEVAENGCWLWTGGIDRLGYGEFWFQGGRKRPHHLILCRTLGRELGERMGALHSCRAKHCVNPEHLREGTHQENMDDKKRDGTGNNPFGERHGCAKLTEDQVHAIRADLRTQQEIANDYGVGRATISAIKLGKLWSHLT